MCSHIYSSSSQIAVTHSFIDSVTCLLSNSFLQSYTFIHWFTCKCLLSNSFLLSSVLGTGDLMVSKLGKATAFILLIVEVNPGYLNEYIITVCSKWLRYYQGISIIEARSCFKRPFWGMSRHYPIREGEWQIGEFLE